MSNLEISGDWMDAHGILFNLAKVLNQEFRDNLYEYVRDIRSNAENGSDLTRKIIEFVQEELPRVRPQGTPESSDEVKAFHRRRQMFIFIGGRLYWASHRLECDHRDWLMSMVEKGIIHSDRVPVFMEECVRGYMDETGVYAYQGLDFRTSHKVETTIITSLKHMKDTADIPEGLPVYAGVKVGKPGEQWPGLKQIATT